MRTPVPATFIACFAAAAFAQPGQQLRIEDHQVFALEQGGIPVAGPGARNMVFGSIGVDGRMGMLKVPGKPFSATEVRRSTQVLANGAKIEHSDSNQLFRDDQGRTRAEQTVDGKTVVVIMDPVAKVVLVLDRDRKTATRRAIPGNAQQGSVSVSDGHVMMLFGSTIIATQSGDGRVTNQKIEIHGGPDASGSGRRATNLEIHGGPEALGPGRHTTEDLGVQLVNGVTAQGTRAITVIPAGSIGNDRDLQVVDEHWFSTDLQMLVKSLNSDPRFGETTYQLTNIVRVPQDPALFQVPPDYTISDEPKR